MATSKTLKVTYAVYPPSSVPDQAASAPNLPPTASSSTYPVPSNPSSPEASSSTSAYYAALGPALRTAQKEINDTLTSWKDAIGDKEKSKEDPGTIGFGRGKAAMMSEEVRGELRGQEEQDEDESSDEAYVIVIAVILIAVILIYLARKAQQKQRQYKANHSTDLPQTTQDIGEPVTFRGTASDVTDRVFGPRHVISERDGEEYTPFNRRSMYSTRGGVERSEEEGDPDLPRYGETRGTTAIRAPPRAYHADAPPRVDGSTAAMNEVSRMTSTPRDAPPQYDRAISTPAVTQPPVVSAA